MEVQAERGQVDEAPENETRLRRQLREQLEWHNEDGQVREGHDRDGCGVCRGRKDTLLDLVEDLQVVHGHVTMFAGDPSRAPIVAIVHADLTAEPTQHDLQHEIESEDRQDRGQGEVLPLITGEVSERNWAS